MKQQRTQWYCTAVREENPRDQIPGDGEERWMQEYSEKQECQNEARDVKKAFTEPLQLHSFIYSTAAC